MTTALAERPSDLPTLPKEQIDLIRRTVANGATDTELQLFLYDCARRGIHPLDKLLHFTKRGGKYTPVTSIDFMRSQAAMTGEMAGSDEPLFTPRHLEPGDHPHEATVTVYRLTQGQRFAYTATARWSEYCPDNAPMWKRMPHTMLGKCAEALALRKAFPQQLAGLYSREEMDQADEPKGYVVTAPPVAPSLQPATEASARVVPNEGDSGHSDDGPDLGVELPKGQQRIVRVDVTPTKNPNVTKYLVTFSTGETASTIKTPLGTLCQELAQTGDPILPPVTKPTKWGSDLVDVMRVPHGYDPYDADPIDPDTIPF